MKRLLPLFALLLALWAGDARALCTITCSCSVSTTPVVFGSFNPLSAANVDSTGSVKVDCGGIAGLLIPYRVDLTTGSGGSYSARRLKSGANQLAYNLYWDSGHTQIWGDGSGSSVAGTASMLLDVLGLSPPATHWIYGRIPGAQTATVPGSYSDTVAVTLTYY